MTGINHAGRAHALLSASSAHRWMICTPSALLESKFPDTTSEAAREGTLAHELCELKLRHYVDTVNFGKRKYNAAVKKLKESELWQNEMEGHTDLYLDFVRTTALGFKTKPYIAIEKKLDLSAYVPNGFGTADCIIICGNILHIVDFKYGKGVPVSAENNPQLMLYALGAYAAYNLLYSIDTVRISIVQPRLSSEADTWELGVPELLTFGEEVKQSAALAIKGEGDFVPGESQCRFCRAKCQCRARAKEDVKLAFSTDKQPPLMSNEEIGEYLRQGADVARWLKDLQDYALSECLAGREVAGWKAVEGRGTREWSDQEKAFATLTEAGIPQTMLFETLPLSLAKIEKMIGKKGFESTVGEYVIKTPGKPTLVPESDKRPAVSNRMTAAEAFDDKEKNE